MAIWFSLSPDSEYSLKKVSECTCTLYMTKLLSQSRPTYAKLPADTFRWKLRCRLPRFWFKIDMERDIDSLFQNSIFPCIFRGNERPFVKITILGTVCSDNIEHPKSSSTSIHCAFHAESPSMTHHWWLTNVQKCKKLTYCSHFLIFLEISILIKSVNLSVSLNSGRTSSEINCFRTMICPLGHLSKIFHSPSYGWFQRLLRN